MNGPLRRIRSYVRRERPFNAGQREDWERLWPRYGVPQEEWGAVGERGRPCVLEVGFGDGEALLAMATADQKRDFVGVETYRGGLLKVLRRVARDDLVNVRLIEADASDVLRALPAQSLDAIHLFFPDPWPKARHHKRRLVSAGFVEDAVKVLRRGGVVHMATDWADYAEEAQKLWAASGGLCVLGTDRAARPLTRFERRGWKLGHISYDLRYRRVT